jgi:methyl-accepting chemotaxis protein
MDKTVQQNAAGAEQSASASDEMNLQADRVNDIVQDLVAMVGMTRNAPSDAGTNQTQSLSPPAEAVIESD